MTISITLTKGYVAIVDDEDADLGDIHWTATINRQPIYAIRGVTENAKHNTQYLHRVILQRVLGRKLTRYEVTDHINNDGLDNRRDNLRIATHKQNLGNSSQHRNKKTLYKGVHGNNSRKNPWVATIFVNGKVKHLGSFKTQETAHIRYCLAAYAKWGEYANFGENSFVPKKSDIQSLVFDTPMIQLRLPLELADAA